MHKSYEVAKKEFDDIAMAYIGKKIHQDIDESTAFYNGVIDSYGNELKKSNKWDYTNFDRFIIALKQRIGEENLRELLSIYSGYALVDDLMIINSVTKPINNTSIAGAKSIVYKMDSAGYLDNARDDVYDENNEDGHNMSWAFTCLTFLFYCIRLGRIPTSIEFDANVIKSTEATFFVSALHDYNEIKAFCINAYLISDNQITTKGVKLVVELAKIAVNSHLLANSSDRINDRSNDWRQLSERG